VLEPLAAYLLLAERLATLPAGHAHALPAAWNIGPDASENRKVLEVAEALVAAFGRGRIAPAEDPDAPHEAHTLTLDCAQARQLLGWQPRLDFKQTVAMTAEWYAAWARGADMVAMTRRQIAFFERLSGGEKEKQDVLS
jgi:CDP-glucose 4,6-dehydratase